MRKSLVSVGVAILAAAVPSQAATIYQEVLGVPNGSATFAGFDSSLGTLNSVEFTYILSGFGQATWTSPDPVAFPSYFIDFVAESSISLSKSGDSLDYYPFAYSSTEFLHSRSTPAFAFAGETLNFTDTANLAFFAGDPITWTVSTAPAFIFPAVGQISVQSAFSNASLQLTYDYTIAAVPEPATWAMMLIGFGAVGATMRAKRRRMNVSVAYA